jgi:arylsulfatase A-like enzyme
LDSQIGRVLDALAKSPHATNTVIVYAADHGLAIGSHGLLGKQSVYEHSMRCPLIIAGPGIPAGGTTAAFTYLFDLFPTLCGLTGAPVPSGLAGSDLRPLWTGEAKRIRDSVFLPYLGLMRSVRDERWKLICYPPVNHRQLFDLIHDPDERVDVSGDPDNAPVVARLLAKMAEWQTRVGDTQPLTVPNPKPLIRDLTGHPRKPDDWQPRWIVEKYF